MSGRLLTTSNKAPRSQAPVQFVRRVEIRRRDRDIAPYCNSWQPKKQGRLASRPCPRFCQVRRNLLLFATAWSFAAQLVPLFKLLRSQNRFDLGADIFADFLQFCYAVLAGKV